MPSYNLALAGYGKMGSAMVAAWRSSKLIAHIDILDPNGKPPNIDNLSFFTDAKSFMEKASTWDMLVLAIKPQEMQNFLESIKIALPQTLPVLSIAAGRTISSFTKMLHESQPVIRAMPNTPAAIGRGMTVISANESVTEPQKAIAANLMGSLGLTEWILDEGLFDAVTALSGSGPAYVFYLIETMAEAGIAAGLPTDFAMKLARQTVIGAAALAEHSPEISATTLRENVTSPNGTTAAALSVLMNGDVQSAMTKAVAEAVKRSKSLAQ